MKAAFIAWLVGLAMLGAAIGNAGADEVRLSELLDNPSTFDGRLLVLRGTLTRLQVHVTRKGNRHYTLELAHQGRNVLVAAQNRPSCKIGTVVRAQGRFDGAKKHVYATTVTCE